MLGYEERGTHGNLFSTTKKLQILTLEKKSGLTLKSTCSLRSRQMGQGFPATLSLRCKEKKLVGEGCSKSCEKMCYCHCHYGIHPHSTSHPCTTFRNSQYMSFESAVWVFHLCGFYGSQPRPGESHSGSGILKWKTTEVIPGGNSNSVSSVHLFQIPHDPLLSHLEVPSESRYFQGSFL